ncbi:peptide-methionine (S)-S-oxide reductase MsrA [Costertonia aggregata]|uniref:Peptide methionine sulfoxide reductase MsrA n=1 Tax=Costertonia aggregata TaxID=343403 RepID=A0A7H9ASC3_9FLAO|nr:peptide-methionine (S)-S-oxide reductase MsrA [Costertonia aggregata]QLG46354.1 peptide-methionine (S)-S-oxide reductase MsrA [Costertonia aggregata]
MKFLKASVLALGILFSASCQSNNKKSTDVTVASTKAKAQKKEKISPQDLSKYETAYFASGCFWCVEAIFESVKGVKEVVSGYSGGTQENPTYEQVGYGKTDHAEAVEVYYDPEKISFTALVQVFFGSHDPTSLNRQGPDRGRQYRSIAFFKNDAEKKIIADYIQLLEESGAYGNDPIVTEVTKFDKFWMAEAYHQDYERLNPNNSYIRNVSIPRYNRFKENFKDYLKEDAH